MGDAQSKEDENLRPDACAVCVRIHTEGLKCRQDDKDSRPAMVKRKRQVNKQFVRSAFGLMALLYDIVDMGYCGTDKKRKDEGWSHAGFSLDNETFRILKRTWNVVARGP